jgi:uncharacterized membrane protein YdjX (TVP38/TMEM64 family)
MIRPAGRSTWIKLAVFLLAAAVAAGLYWQFRDVLDLERLAEREQQLRGYQRDHPLAVTALAFLIYVVVCGLSLPGATVLTLLLAWYFGFFHSLVLVSFASTAGATLAFLLSRFLLRDFVERHFGERLKDFDRALQREGPFFLFSLRLIPAVPFFVINAVMGLTPMKARTFWWVSQIGMLPGTAVYVYAGSSVPQLVELADRGIGAVFSAAQITQILIALALLGLFPWGARALLRWLGYRARETE